jgi:hypothetical protein
VAFTCDGPDTGPVCDCDGQVVEGGFAACNFYFDSKPFADPTDCATGTFPCGNLECTRNLEACVVVSGGPMGSAPSYACKTAEEIGGNCSGIPDCGCLDLTSQGCSTQDCCTSDADHQETITIQAP